MLWGNSQFRLSLVFRNMARVGARIHRDYDDDTLSLSVWQLRRVIDCLRQCPGPFVVAMV